MGVRYVCKHCGYVLWEFKHVGQDYFGIPTPSEIMLATGGICPRCKRELSIPTLSDIVIKPKPSLIGRNPTHISLFNRSNEYERPPLMGIRNPGEFMAAQEI